MLCRQLRKSYTTYKTREDEGRGESCEDGPTYTVTFVLELRNSTSTPWTFARDRQQKMEMTTIFMEVTTCSETLPRF
jgi:hypothetical protein